MCTGSGAACPADTYQPSGTSCRASAGVCDVAEACTGSSIACPADSFVAAGTVCRAVAGVCDVAEACTGGAAACPADSFVAAGTVCRASTSIAACDPAEACTGGMATCPADVVTRVPTAETCNSVDDNCNGVVDDGTTTACASAESIGGVVVGGTASRTGFVAAPAGSERWYSISFLGTSGGTPSISLSGATASLRIEIYTACGGTPFCSGTPGTAWSFTDNTAGTGFYTRNVAWPATVYVRIYRTSATTTCGSYTLNVSR